VSAPQWLEYAEAPEWLGRPLTGRPDGSGDGDVAADTADLANMGAEVFDTGGDLAINGGGIVGTAISQYRQSTASTVGFKVVEALVAGGADFALGAVSVIGTVVRMIPGGGMLADLLSANTQPLIDKAVNQATDGKFSVAGFMTGSIRVISAYAEDRLLNNTKAVSRLKARSDMDNTTPAVTWMLNKLRGGGSGGDSGS
jgi:hypothetical protein